MAKTQAQNQAMNQYLQNYGGKENAVGNPLSFKEAFSKAGFKSALKAGAGSLISGVAGAVGGIAGGAIGGGLSSGAGNAIGDIGGTVGSAVGAVNPILGGIISAGTGIVGGLVNRAFGTKVNEEALRAANEGTARLSNFTSNADSFDAIKGPEAVAKIGDVYEGGWFSSSKARRKNEELRRQREVAKSWAERSVTNNVTNLVDDQLNDALANYSAFGGYLGDFGGGALDYGLAMDYMTIKKRETEAKNKTAGLVPQPRAFAIGGDLQTHGADWTDGLVRVDAGGSHEENPNQGIQMGVDQNGTPNLVEENETIFNDYVYSARIKCDEATKKLFHLPKKRDITFAELSKKLEKEAAERPNDAISQRGLEASMSDLAEQQERQKAEMEAQRAKEAFEALTPEEQTAVMKRAAQEEQMAQQAMMQQQGAEMASQPTEEELAMAEQQEQEYNLDQEPQTFAKGGKLYEKLFDAVGVHTAKEFRDWAKENNIVYFADLDKDDVDLDKLPWEGLLSTETFQNALAKTNPALADAMRRGYDFGMYSPENSGKATIQSISRGNWKTTDGKGWRGSEDLAFKQATEGLSDAEIDALTTEQLAEKMRNTEAYKNTSKWLETPDNALMYLNTLLNDPDTPQVAKDYAARFVKDGRWKDGFNYDYATVFGSNGKGVRETNPGTYWHTAMEANRGNQTGNFVINEDGTIEPIIGAVPTDWTAAGNYNWATPENGIAYNYYRRPTAATTATAITDPEGEKTPEEKAKDYVPDLRKETSFGMFGPLLNLGLMSAGVGRPNTSGLFAAASRAGDYRTADWMPRGDFAVYKPDDSWFYTSPILANSRAADRSILNSGGNQGSKMAGILANNYNTQVALGQAQRQQLDHNFDKYMKVKTFNGDIYKDNQREFGQDSRFDASAYNEASRANAQLNMQAAAQQMDADRWWASNLYGNINGLFDRINQWEKWKRDRNAVAKMAANGIFGTGTDNTPIFSGYVKEDANGGKIKRKKNKKRGLTF